MGGTRRIDTSGAANALLLHPNCHEWVERNRATASEQGFLVSQQHDPAAIPVQLWSGWCLLTPDGGYIRCASQVGPLQSLQTATEAMSAHMPVAPVVDAFTVDPGQS